MRHLDDGTLRRMVDEPLSLSSQARQHYAECAPCRARRVAIEADALAVRSVLGSRAAEIGDAKSSYAGVTDRTSSGSPATASPTFVERITDFYRWRARPLATPVIAAALAAAAVVLLLFTPVGTVAQNFLTIFEPRQFVAIPVSRGDLEYMPDLESFGTIAQHPALDPKGRAMLGREVASATQAFALTGIRVRQPVWLPSSVPHAVRYGIAPRTTASFTFSAAKARAYAAAARRPMPPMPPGLDGSTLTLQVGPMVMIGYGTMPLRQHAAVRPSRKGNDESGMHLPPLVIVEAVAPQVRSTGATAREIEAYLLQMPGVPARLADEIRAIGDPTKTMPIPVPVDKAFSENVSIDGVSGLAIGDDTGVGGIIVWQKNGMVYGVGGALRQKDLMEIAQSLR
jgi:hypothetical protein